MNRDWSAADPDTVSLECAPQKMRPIGNQVVVKLDPLPEKSEGGLFLPVDNRSQEHHTGTVVAVGPGKVAPKTHVRYPMETKIGDKVLLGRYVGSNLEFEGQTYRIMPEEQLYCIIED